MGRRVIFHELVTLDQAAEVLLKFAAPLGAEKVGVASAYGRVLAEDVVAPLDVPPFRQIHRGWIRRGGGGHIRRVGAYPRGAKGGV
jgi:hypothetical protein